MTDLETRLVMLCEAMAEFKKVLEKTTESMERLALALEKEDED